MSFSMLFVHFIFYSFLGWVWESIYCTIKERKWQDRGFLFGPICPIYGSCVALIILFCRYLPFLLSPEQPVWKVFLICMFGSAVAEFSTSYVLEKRFNARWWDYSNRPLNLDGRICLQVSIAFGVTGVLIVRYLMPVINRVSASIPLTVVEILAIAMALAMGADWALTEASLSALLQHIEEASEEFNRRAQETYTNISETPKKLQEMKNEVEEKLQEKKDEIEEKLQERRNGMEEILQDKRALLGYAFSDRRDNMEENLSGNRAEGEAYLKTLVEKQTARLNAGERHVLRNIKTFRPGKRISLLHKVGKNITTEAASHMHRLKSEVFKTDADRKDKQ